MEMRVIPTGNMRGKSLWVFHMFPRSPSPLLIRKWNYILKRFNVWYEDDDGDNITIGTCSELISAFDDGFSRFHFKVGDLLDDPLLFKMMEELNRVKIRYRVFGMQGGRIIKLDKETMEIIQLEIPSMPDFDEIHGMKEELKLPEEPVDTAILDQPVVPHRFRSVEGRNSEYINEDLPQHDDIAPTPDELSPAPSPRLEPFENSYIPLLDLPCLGPPMHHPRSPAPVTDDPPEAAPSESEFPSHSIPGAFPVDHPNDDVPIRMLPFQPTQTLSNAVQSTLDHIARLGHLTITTTQNTLSNGDTYDAARNTLNTGTQSARANIETARTNLEASMEAAMTGLHSGLANARNGLTMASTAVTNATRQAEQTVRSAVNTTQMAPATADRLVRDLRSAGGRIDRAVQEMTLRLQRRIDQRALGLNLDEPQNTPLNQEQHHEEGESQSPLPGSFPRDRSSVDECTDKLVEMGFFEESQRDMAGAVSVAADGNIADALAIVEGLDS